MSGALGTTVLAGVTSGVLSTSGVVDVASASGGVASVSVSVSGVLTTAGVGRALVSISGDEVLVFVTGVSEMGASTSVAVSSLGAGVRTIGVDVVIGNVAVELVVMVKVCVIGTV